jgi:hypothetical protein
MKDIILKAVDSEYLLKIEDEILGFHKPTPTQMLTCLRNRGGALDYANTKTLLAEQDGYGMSVKFHNYTLIGLKKQSKDSPVPASTWT